MLDIYRPRPGANTQGPRSIRVCSASSRHPTASPSRSTTRSTTSLATRSLRTVLQAAQQIVPVARALRGVAVWLMTSLAVVEPHRRGLLLVNGKPTGSEPGPTSSRPAFRQGRRAGVHPDRNGRRGATRRDVVEETATGVRVLQLGPRSHVAHCHALGQRGPKNR